MYKCKLNTARWAYRSQEDADFIALLRSYNFTLELQEDRNICYVVEGGSVGIDSLEKLFSLIDIFGNNIVIQKSSNPEYSYEITIYDDYLE